jgi:Fe2+ transport system protein B
VASTLIENKGHDPRLSSIEMVETVLKKHQQFPSKSALQRALPKTIQTQTFNRILNYLEKSNKIIFKDRTVIWIFSDDPHLRKIWKKSIRL